MSDALFQYQKEGAAWLVGKGRRFSYLADDMGLGKSAQAITAADIIGAKRILIVCPSVARVNWLRELEKWSITPRDYFIPFKVKSSPTKNQSVICSYDWVGVNYEKLNDEKNKWVFGHNLSMTPFLS